MNKYMKKIPYAMALSRAASFIPLILDTVNEEELSKSEQITLMTNIMLSDIFDGIVSRKYNETEKEKTIFRLTDTIIDKTGILLCTQGLYKSEKLPKGLYISILIHNGILLTTGGINFLFSKNKERKKIESNNISRLYTALIGVSFFLFKNEMLNKKQQKIWITFMKGLSITTLISQFDEKIISEVNNKENKAMTLIKK